MTCRIRAEILSASIAILTCLTLSGCDTSTEVKETADEETFAECETIKKKRGNDDLTECNVRLSDGRKVTCLESWQDGLSCDWGHATQTDKNTK